MILWTIQSKEAWETIQRTGLLRAEPGFVSRDFISAYEWMAKQMEIRIEPSKGCLPLWSWYQWESERKKKPDLRFGGHLPKGDHGVRIEFKIEDNKVVLSDFHLWHYVLNYWYLPATEDDDNTFEAELNEHGLSFYETKPLKHADFHKRIVDSWNRVFDLNWADPGESITFRREKKSIQATFWKLRLEQVRKVQPFTAR
jgi:hypothetical protein